MHLSIFFNKQSWYKYIEAFLIATAYIPSYQ